MASYGYVMLETGIIDRGYVLDRYYGKLPKGFVIYRPNGIGSDHSAGNLVAMPKAVLAMLKQAQAKGGIRFTYEQAKAIAKAADDKVADYVAINQERLRRLGETRQKTKVMNEFQNPMHQLRKQIFDDYAVKWAIAELALKAPKQDVKMPDYFSGKGEVTTKVAKTRKTVTVWRIKQGDLEGAVREVAL
jgi:hypothetical protein